jgi:N-methylhydantoinase B/oxoprolinase/acetone carboxylase alpha subunit
LKGGQGAKSGENSIVGKDGKERPIAGKAQFVLRAGEVLRVRTPGGGGFGAPHKHG